MGQRTFWKESAMLDQLTPREREVLTLVSDGQSTKEIAFSLGIAFKTAACHRHRLMKKLAAHNTAEMLGVALRRDLIPLPGRESQGPDQSDPLTRANESDPGVLRRAASLLEKTQEGLASLRDSLEYSGVLLRTEKEAVRHLNDEIAVLQERCWVLRQAAR
jgi:DNA-binding CsgD family transcriptional regulator